RVEQLLHRPDRLLGLILIGNNLVNIFAASLTTLIAMRLLGDSGVAIGGLLLTVVMLVFAAGTPKKLAALHPERLAFFSSIILKPLSYLMYPFVVMVNAFSNGITRIFGMEPTRNSFDLHLEELRTVVDEAGSLIPDQ